MAALILIAIGTTGVAVAHPETFTTAAKIAIVTDHVANHAVSRGFMKCPPEIERS